MTKKELVEILYNSRWNTRACGRYDDGTEYYDKYSENQLANFDVECLEEIYEKLLANDEL